jgi:hypothetical protein
MANIIFLDITWIIIILIIISIFVTCFEVFLRFGLLSGVRHSPPATAFDLQMDNVSIDTPWTFMSVFSRSISRIGLTAAWVLVGSSLLRVGR